MLNYLKLLVQLVLAPENGWEDIEDENLPAIKVLRSGFIPLLIITSLSVFAGLLYHVDATIGTLVRRAIITFGAFFVAIFIAEFFFSLFFIRDTAKAVDSGRVRSFIIWSLSVMALTTLIMNSVPFSPVLILLPLYTIVVIRRATDFMSVLPERVGNFMVLSILSIFLPPFIIIFLFRVLLG